MESTNDTVITVVLSPISTETSQLRSRYVVQLYLLERRDPLSRALSNNLKISSRSATPASRILARTQARTCLTKARNMTGSSSTPPSIQSPALPRFLARSSQRYGRNFSSQCSSTPAARNDMSGAQPWARSLTVSAIWAARSRHIRRS